MNENLLLEVLCPRCGEIDLAVDQVWLVVPSVAGRTHLCFRCTECGEVARGPLTEAAVAFLVDLIAVEELDVPAEALEVHSGAPLHLDDLVDLMLALESPIPVPSRC